MFLRIAPIALMLCIDSLTHGQSRASGRAFEVATVREVDPPLKSSRFLKMQGPHRFVATNFTLRLLIAAAYDANPKAVTGGPGWVDTTKYDIQALTPGERQPTRPEQMEMLRGLLEERFHLTLRHEQKD